MNILYVGDIMADPGIEVVQRLLPQVREKEKVDFVVAQAENVTDGRGLSMKHYQVLWAAGIDACTGGNWTLHREDTVPLLNDPAVPIVRPANYPEGTPGLRYKFADSRKGRVLIVSLMGQIVGRDADKPVENPLKTIDAILAETVDEPHVATIVNLHGDFSSEKRIIGYYLDGRVSMVVGDHWHVPTADADVLPKGTAHMTDVGMCGSLDSSLGVSLESVIPRWRDGIQTRNILETSGRMQFNALLADIDESTGRARSARHIQIIT